MGVISLFYSNQLEAHMDPLWIWVEILGLSALVTIGFLTWEGPKKR
jgi:hypothetical protein